jgi:hypothetical protein
MAFGQKITETRSRSIVSETWPKGDKTGNKGAPNEPKSTDSYIKPENIEDIQFEKRDLEVFDIPDPKTRISTVRNYFFPRIEDVLVDAIDLIRDIYELDPFEKMSFERRPANRMEAKNNQPFEEVRIGLSGKRQNFRELSVTKKDGSPYALYPSILSFELDKSGALRVILYPYVRSVDKIYKTKIRDLLLANKDLLEKIFNYAGIELISYDNKYNENYFFTFTEFAKNMPDGDGHFKTRDRFVPITWETGLYDLRNALIALYPLLDAFVAVADGPTDNLSDNLNDLLLKYINFEKNFNQGLYEEEEDNEEEGDDNDWDNDEENEKRHSPEEGKNYLDLDNYSLLRPGVRWQVLMRDNWKCLSCGRSTRKHGIVLNVDHIIPRSKGGTDSLDNLQTLCWECNIGKSNKDRTDLRNI